MPPAMPRSLMKAALSYLEARGQLFQVEAKEAIASYSGSTRCAATGGVMLTLAWLLMLPAGISLASRHFGLPWEYLALGVSGVHLLVAFVLFMIAGAKTRRLRPFEESINQLREDRAWLAENRPQN